MATFSYVRTLRGYQITLTTAATKYNLWTLLNAIDSAVPLRCNELMIQNDEANTGMKVLVGDVNLSTTRYGYKLLAGNSRAYVTREKMIDIQDFYLQSDTNAAKINIEMFD